LAATALVSSGEAVAAGRVLLEGPYHHRGLLVGLEHGFSAPAARFAADVSVAVGRDGGPPTLGGLLVDTLSDLLREVRRIELGDRSEDPSDQLARSRILDALGHGDELHSGHLVLGMGAF